jgi:hypothetical protein
MVEFLPNCDVFIHSYTISQKQDIVDIFIRWGRICSFETKQPLSLDPLAWEIAAQSWNRLSELQLSGGSLSDSFSLPTVPNPGLPALQRLVLNSLVIVSPLPSINPNTLHTLIIAGVSFPTSSSLVELIQNHHLSLRRMYLRDISSWTARSDFILDDIGTYLLNLESLYISDNDSLSTDILSSLPQTITDVFVEIWTPFSALTCTEFLHKYAERTPRLAKLYVVAHAESSPIVEWDVIVEQAARIGVEFRFARRLPHGDAPVFQVGARQPAVPSWASFVAVF